MKGNYHISLADPLFQMGLIFIGFGKNELALEHIQKCLKIRKKYYKNQKHSSISEIHTVLGNIYKAL